eukprot:TRINITY_DN595_c0_g1_i4.p1 TRINITY_DN595_c0_g1~~TRINITY_DN595_c0_g1_i4.p1  ORF type:complete len:1871 (+),score=396.90 TRINITY_DN595_c0_g1_i4:294-5615(+)
MRVAWFTKLAKEFLDFNKPADRKKMSQWENTITYLATQPDRSRPSVSPAQMTEIVQELSSPLFQRFKEEYSRSCRFTPFDTYDHPVACLLAVSSASPDAIAELKGLYTVHHQDFTAAAVDQQQLIYYILIQDMSVPQRQSEVDKVFAEMKAQFGAQVCKLLQLNRNSSGGESLEVDPSKWMHPETMDEQTPAREGVAKMLSAADETALSTMMQSFIEQTLLSQMTRRIKGLHQTVSDKRQGKIGKMMGYWFGKQNDNQTKPNRDGPHFAPDSCEMQLRKLGDLCFLLHDYETALGFYKNLKSELGSTPDSRTNYQAACFEAMGMCSTLLRQRRDTDSWFDQGAQLYLRGRKPDCALRTRLFQYSLSKINRGHRSPEIIKLASQIEEKRPLYYGMFHEEAGLSYLYCGPGEASVSSKIRKFAFSLTLAGCKYSSCGCTDQALRANLLAAAIYRNMNLEKWEPINEHIQLTLARLWKHKNDLTNAVHHMGLYIVQTKTSKLMSEYNGYLLAYLESSKSDSYQLPLPAVDIRSIDINVNPSAEVWINRDVSPQQQASAMPKINTVGIENEWDRMELDFTDAVRTQLGTYKTHPQAATRRQKQCEQKYIIQNEQVLVQFKLENPLPSKLSLDNVRLLYEVTDTQPGTLELSNPPPDIKSLLQGSPIDGVCMSPSSDCTIKLTFASPKVGWCRIVGFAWTLVTTQRVNSYYLFCNSDMSIDGLRGLVLKCTEQAPLLDLYFDTPPPLMTLDGQLHYTNMHMKNIGGRTMTHIALKISTSNSHLMTIEPQEDTISVQSKDISGLVDFYIFPRKVNPGQTISVPIIVRSCSGNNSTSIESNHIPMLLSYDDDESGLRRMCKGVIRQVVLPSVSCRVLSFPPPGVCGENQFIMCLEMRSQNNRITDLSINGIQALSHDWEISLLDAEALSDVNSLPIKTGSTYALTLLASRRMDNSHHCSPVWGKDLTKLLTHFIHHSPRDELHNTGGAGSLADPSMEKSGGMSMFLDRKEKKKAADLKGDATEMWVTKRFPLSFSIEWKVRDIAGQTVMSCEPYETSVKPKGQWQDSESLNANLLRDRSLPSNENNQTTCLTPLLPNGQLSEVATERDQNGFIGLSLGYSSTIQHDFSRDVTCQVPINIVVTNHRHLPTTLWVILKNTKVATSSKKDESAPPVSGTSNPPPLARGGVPQPAAPPAQKTPSVNNQNIIRFPTFYWQGKCKYKISLQPFSSRSVTAHAQFTRAGTYNINQFDVQIINNTGIEIQGIDDEMSLLTVDDSSVVVENEEEDPSPQQVCDEAEPEQEDTTRQSPVDVAQLEDRDDDGSTDLDVPLSEPNSAHPSNVGPSPSPPFSASPSIDSKSPVASPTGGTPSRTPDPIPDSDQQISTEQFTNTRTDGTISPNEVSEQLRRVEEKEVKEVAKAPENPPSEKDTEPTDSHPSPDQQVPEPHGADMTQQQEDVPPVADPKNDEQINDPGIQEGIQETASQDHQVAPHEEHVDPFANPSSTHQSEQLPSIQQEGQHQEVTPPEVVDTTTTDAVTTSTLSGQMEPVQHQEEQGARVTESESIDVQQPDDTSQQQLQSAESTTPEEVAPATTSEPPNQQVDPFVQSDVPQQQLQSTEATAPSEDVTPTEAATANEPPNQQVDPFVQSDGAPQRQLESTEETAPAEEATPTPTIESSHQPEDPFQQSGGGEGDHVDPFQNYQPAGGDPFQQKYSSGMNEVLQKELSPASPPVDPFVDSQQWGNNDDDPFGQLPSQPVEPSLPDEGNVTQQPVDDPFANQS